MNSNRNCRQIFATTIHELGHASHWNLGKNDYTFADDVLVESWAHGVKWSISRLEYPGYSINYGRMNYSGIVQSMIDGISSKTSTKWWDSSKDEWGSPSISKTYQDSVSGYTVRQIEDAIDNQRKWNNWKDNIKNKYNNATENHLDAAFDYWNSK